jgi:hypothetical protein
MQLEPGAAVKLIACPGRLFRVYAAGTRSFLGGVRAMPAEEFGPWQTWVERELRVLFGFDGFIAPSLRSAVDAFTARRPLSVDARSDEMAWPGIIFDAGAANNKVPQLFVIV